jgi:hypothetical protein
MAENKSMEDLLKEELGKEAATILEIVKTLTKRDATEAEITNAIAHELADTTEKTLAQLQALFISARVHVRR